MITVAELRLSQFQSRSNSACTMRRIILHFAAIASMYAVTFAQETKQDLGRPEWQLCADLEFRSACQSSLQKLCLELIQSYQNDPADPANAKLLIAARDLLDITDGKLPKTLPAHPASIEYAKARRAAVVN